MKKIIQAIALSSFVLLTACAQASAAEANFEQTAEAQISSGEADTFEEGTIEQTAQAQISSGKLHSFDENLVKGVFNPNGTDDVFLSIDAGKIMYFEKEEKNPGIYVAAMNVETYYDFETKERYREHFKFREIDGITSEEALKTAQEIVDELGIPNLEEPQIFTCPSHTYVFDENDIVEIKDSYYILYLADENKPYYDGKRGYAEFIIFENGLVSFYANYICD